MPGRCRARNNTRNCISQHRCRSMSPIPGTTLVDRSGRSRLDPPRSACCSRHRSPLHGHGPGSHRRRHRSRSRNRRWGSGWPWSLFINARPPAVVVIGLTDDVLSQSLGPWQGGPASSVAPPPPLVAPAFHPGRVAGSLDAGRRRQRRCRCGRLPPARRQWPPRSRTRSVGPSG